MSAKFAMCLSSFVNIQWDRFDSVRSIIVFSKHCMYTINYLLSMADIPDGLLLQARMGGQQTGIQHQWPANFAGRFQNSFRCKKNMIRLNKIFNFFSIYRAKQYLKIVNAIQYVGRIIIALASIMHVREYDFPNIWNQCKPKQGS